jgi:hypothetical protein
LSPAQEKLSKSLSQKNKLGVVFHVCNPSYSGGRSKRITVSGQPREKHETLSEKLLKAKGLLAKGPGSSIMP